MWIYYAIILFIAILGADQFSKFWIVNNIKTLSEHEFIPDFLSITNVKNTGAAWSMFTGSRGFFVIIGIVAIAIAGYYLWKCRYDFGYETAITLFIAGACGNLISRIVHGYVIDMIQTDFINFPIFNVADSALTVGVILLMILIGFNKPLRKRD
ncbi:signal peptidase II [Acetilactobacillus jinshanensis]|uniref:Lipoprotein signal peptidase n=1 Tax=Acetilactobacillus jinshanensis TaxID=1720083 RepID=A0A4P6ZM90_9LACO|nr:signal peptidase II [Acetilactobacillus jinshanensis]QBP18542.1 signal peptidase II [Acetilactobacillus jinshanensis]URL61416.1 signal peptidase II [uncultured bacterium]